MAVVIEYSQKRFQTLYQIVGGIKSSPQLTKLISDCPSNMDQLSYAEILQETIQEIVGTFIFLLEPRPRMQSITMTDFIAKIKESYDTSNPRTRYAVAVLEALEPI